MGRYSHFLKYNLSGARGYSVIGKGLCIHRNMIIPKTHRGAAIVGIGENAFAGDTALTSVVIPENGGRQGKTRLFPRKRRVAEQNAAV